MMMKYGRRSGRHDLSGRCDAQQQAAPAGEQFLRDQDSERRADGAANDPGRLARERRSIELGVIAGPAVERFGIASSVAGERYRRPDRGCRSRAHRRRSTPFAPRLAQQGLRPKHGWRAGLFVVENDGHGSQTRSSTRTRGRNDRAGASAGLRRRRGRSAVFRQQDIRARRIRRRVARERCEIGPVANSFTATQKAVSSASAVLRIASRASGRRQIHRAKSS